MVNTQSETGKAELTLLALGGRGMSLYGDNKGNVSRVCDRCIGRRANVRDPKRVYIDNYEPQMLLGTPFVWSEDIPKDVLLSFGRYRDAALGLGVYAAFDPIRKVWYVREVVDPETKQGSGRFFFEGAELIAFDLETVC